VDNIFIEYNNLQSFHHFAFQYLKKSHIYRIEGNREIDPKILLRLCLIFLKLA